MLPHQACPLLLGHGGQEGVAALLHLGLDGVVGQLQVELLVVDAAVADDGLGVAVVLEPGRVTEQRVQLLRRGQLLVSSHPPCCCSQLWR